MLIFKRFAYYVAIPKPYGYGQYVVQPHCILFDYAPYALIPISGVFVSTSAFPQQISIRRTWIKRLCIYGKINDTKNRKQRSEESRVGKECIRQFRSRWSPYHLKKKKKKKRQ